MTTDVDLLLRRWGSRATGNPVRSQYREDTELPVSELLPLAAIGYLATIAYPDNWARRDTVVLALKAWIAKSAKQYGRERRWPQEWRDYPAIKMRRNLRKAQNIIWFERFPATAAAMELSATRLTAGSRLQVIGPDKVVAACAKYAPLSQISAQKFVERAWTPSKSVFHLVHAFRNTFETESVYKLPLGHFVVNPQWVATALESANKIIPALTSAKIVEDRELILLHSA